MNSNINVSITAKGTDIANLFSLAFSASINPWTVITINTTKPAMKTKVASLYDINPNSIAIKENAVGKILAILIVVKYSFKVPSPLNIIPTNSLDNSVNNP